MMQFKITFRRSAVAVIALLLLALSAADAQKQIALTFDDLPVASYSQNPSPAAIADQRRITRLMLDTLVRHHAPAIGFVNEIKLNMPGARDAYAALLQQWMAAGFTLGCHGYSHLALGATPLEDYELDFARGTVITSLLMTQSGRTEHYYRYPYNDTGDTRDKRDAFVAFLARQKYTVAPMTLENDDWMYSGLYAPAQMANDSVQQVKLRAAYLDENARKIAFVEELSQREFKRPIPQVALMHVNTLNADALDAVLSQFEQRGYTFITLDHALADAAYATADGYVGTAGISWLERWAPTLHIDNAMQGDPDPPVWVMSAYKTLAASGR